MKNLEEADERFRKIEGALAALDVRVATLVAAIPSAVTADARRTASTPDAGATRHRAALAGGTEALLLSAARVLTFAGGLGLTSASGFFFGRDERLYLVTSRHVLFDEPSGHAPDRIEIELHTDAQDLARCATFSILLYREGIAVWRQAEDGGGDVDVAVIELDRAALPSSCVMQPFGEQHLPNGYDAFEVGDALAIPGFPLGFHDTVHHLPVVRQAAIASAYGIRFQSKGYFLTDGRTHRGSSGAPVLRRRSAADGGGWSLLGVHSSRMDMATRDLVRDESLGLNCAWYSDILLTLTEPSTAGA